MHTSSAGQNASETIRDMALQSLDSDKATDIEVIDLRGQTSLADFMIVASGTSSRHVGAVAEKLTAKLEKQAGLHDIRTEGQKNCDWVVIDAGDVIVHVFKPEVRDFYNLEKMWRQPHPGADIVTA